MRRRPARALLLGGLLLAASALVAAPVSAATKIALEGEASPGGNGLFVFFGLPHFTSTGQLIFFASTDATVPAGAAAPGCVFRYATDGAGGTPLLCIGGSVGLAGADFWLEIDALLMDANRHGDLVFYGKYRETGGGDHEGVFHLSSAGVLTDLGIITSSVLETRINDSNQMVVSTPHQLLTTTPAGPPVQIFLHMSDLLPDDPAFMVNDSIADIGPGGELAISVTTESVCCGSGPYDFVVYTYDGGVFTRIAEEFQPIGPFNGASNAHPRYTPDGRLLLLLEGDPFQTLGIAAWNGAAWSHVFSDPGFIFNRVVLVTAGLNRYGYGNSIGEGKPFWGIAGAGVTSSLLAVGDPLLGGTVIQVQPASGLSTTHWAAVATLSLTGNPDALFVGRTESLVPSLGLAGAVTLAVMLGAAASTRLRR